MKKKYEKITFILMTYNRIQFNFDEEFEKLNKFKSLYVVLYFLKNIDSDIKVNFFNGKRYSKIHTLVKGPKCHKVGKHLIKYAYSTYYITFLKNLSFNKNLMILEKYFSYIIDYLNVYDTNLSSNNKIILNTYINIL